MRGITVFVGLAMVVVGLPGCASQHEAAPAAAPGAVLQQPIDVERSSALVVENWPAGVKEPEGSLTLGQALGLALLGNAELAVYGWEVRAAEARALQARVRPNPELAVEVEDVGGSGDLAGFDGAETTVSLGQLIEVAGKRAKRARVAVLAGEASAWEYEAQRLGVYVEVSKAFYAAAAAQEQAALRQELVALSEEVASAVSERVSAGKDSPIEETRARVALATAQIEAQQALRRQEASRRVLAGTWGGREVRFERVEAAVGESAAAVEVEQLAALLAEHPAVRRWGVVQQQSEAAEALEEARAWQDPTVEVGVRHWNETGDATMLLGVAVPLPVFDRNEGAILAAKHERAKAQAQQTAAVQRLQTELVRACEALATARAEVTGLEGEVLPGAKRAFEAMREAYEEGKVDYLRVLDTQRVWFEARVQRVEARLAYQQARAQVEGLIGQGLDATVSGAGGQMERTDR